MQCVCVCVDGIVILNITYFSLFINLSITHSLSLSLIQVLFLGVILSSPSQFPILVLISLSFVVLSNFLFFLYFVRERREDAMNAVSGVSGVEMEEMEGKREREEEEKAMEECEI